MHSQAKAEPSGPDSGRPGGSAKRHLSWVLVAWTVAAIAVVAWIMPRGRAQDRVPDADRGGESASVSTLVKRGYRAMEQRESDPAAVERALADFERGYALEPDHLDARFGLAWAKQVRGLPESEWRGLYESTIGEASLLAYLSLYNLAYAEKRAGRDEAAIALLERAVQMMPERADGWLELGRAREAVGKSAEAAEAFQRAAELER